MLITLSITGCTIEYFLFIHQIFIITFVTFYTTHNTSHDKLYKTFKWDWEWAGPGQEAARAAPHWVHTSEYSENHLVIPTPHNTTNTSSVTITHHSPSPTWIRSKKSILILNVLTQTNQSCSCMLKQLPWKWTRVEEDLEMFIQPGNTLLPFSSNCSKSRCPLNINHNSSIISKIWIQFWKNDLAAWFMQGAIL